MIFTSLVSIIAGAAVAGAMPVAESDLSVRAQSNCTTYSSTSAGTVCLQRPSDCTATYLVASGDTCDSIAQRFNNFTESILYYWNPDIGRSCLGLRAFTPVCINTPWYHFTPPIQPAARTIETTANRGATDQPVPVIFQTAGNCSKYELAGPGVFVSTMVQDNGITFDQFYTWNPAVNRSNPQTFSGYWYAVGC